MQFTAAQDTEKPINPAFSKRGSFLVATLAKIVLLLIVIRYTNGPMLIEGARIQARSSGALPPLSNVGSVPAEMNNLPEIDAGSIVDVAHG